MALRVADLVEPLVDLSARGPAKVLDEVLDKVVGSHRESSLDSAEVELHRSPLLHAVCPSDPSTEPPWSILGCHASLQLFGEVSGLSSNNTAPHGRTPRSPAKPSLLGCLTTDFGKESKSLRLSILRYFVAFSF